MMKIGRGIVCLAFFTLIMMTIAIITFNRTLLRNMYTGWMDKQYASQRRSQ